MPDNGVAMIIEAVELQFGKLDGLTSQRIDQLVAFKEMVSKKTLNLLKDIDELKDLFKDFVFDEQVKLQNLPVFEKGVEFY